MGKPESLIREDSGQDLTEYALLAGFISIVAVVTIKLIGPLVDSLYQKIGPALKP